MTTAFTLVLVAVFAALSSFVQRVTGFGFGIVMMTMLPYVMPTYGEATALSGILAACMAIVPAVRHRRYVRLRKFLPILLTFLVLSFFSVKVLTVVDGHSLKRIFGVVLVFVSIYLFFISGKVHLKPTMPVQVSMGALDICLERLYNAVTKAGGIMVVTADHGNADDMYEHDKTGAVKLDKNGEPRRKTSHSLNPVPCFIYDPDYKGEYSQELNTGLGISSVAGTCAELLGFKAPADYDKPVINWK